MKTTTENKIQQEIVMWFNNNYCLAHHKPRLIIYSIPNDSSNAIEQQRKVNTGLLKGVSDLELVLPKENVYIEVKTLTGVQGRHQSEFQKRVEALNRKYFLVRSLDEFKKVVYSHI